MKFTIKLICSLHLLSSSPPSCSSFFTASHVSIFSSSFTPLQPWPDQQFRLRRRKEYAASHHVDGKAGRMVAAGTAALLREQLPLRLHVLPSDENALPPR
jgi:hypothetical protein